MKQTLEFLVGLGKIIIAMCLAICVFTVMVQLIGYAWAMAICIAIAISNTALGIHRVYAQGWFDKPEIIIKGSDFLKAQ